MKKTKLWYVIADGGRARFVERDETGAFRTVASFVSTELHERSHDLGLDRPARVKESAGPTRHAVEPRRDLHEAAKEDFVKLVAEELDAEHFRGQFDKLVLVAPPGVLTELKEKLSKPITKLVVDGLQKRLDQGAGPRSDRASSPGALEQFSAQAETVHVMGRVCSGHPLFLGRKSAAANLNRPASRSRTPNRSNNAPPPEDESNEEGNYGDAVSPEGAANLNAKVDGQGCRLPGRLYARPGASIGQSPIVAGPVLADTQFQLAP